MGDTKLEIPTVLTGEGAIKQMIRVRIECSECGEPAVYRHTYLLPNARNNPASSAYRRDDCSWCADHEVFTCADCKRPSVDGYGWCSTFTAGRRFSHLFLEWKDASTPDPRIAAAQSLADALKAMLAPLPDHDVIEALMADAGLGYRKFPVTYSDRAVTEFRAALAAWEKLQ